MVLEQATETTRFCVAEHCHVGGNSLDSGGSYTRQSLA